METYHTWEADGKKYRAVYDEMHETRGSYAYDTTEETRAAEDEEIAALESGKWIVVGIFTYEKQPHCETCSCPAENHPWTETDSFWGIVIKNSTSEVERFAREGM
jgi:hypothetical protein